MEHRSVRWIAAETARLFDACPYERQQLPDAFQVVIVVGEAAERLRVITVTP